jgi:hypothetical protein
VADDDGIGHVHGSGSAGKAALLDDLGKDPHGLQPVHFQAPYCFVFSKDILPLFVFFAEGAMCRLRFMDEQYRSITAATSDVFHTHRRITMNAKQFIAATAVFVAAGSAFAADAPAAAAAAATVATNAVVVASADSVIASNLNVPSITVTNPQSRSRADVRAEAVEFVKNHKTAFAIQLEQYKN